MGKINNFSTEAITTLVTLTKTALNNKVDKVDGKELSTNDYTTEEKTKLAGIAEEANKTTIVDNLTSTDAASALSANQGKVLDDKIAAINTSLGDYATTADIPTKVSDLTNDSAFQTADEVTAAINAKVSSTYKAGGSTAFASLPAADEAHLGLVYNITNAFTTTDSFVEGTGKSYPAGTNVVIVFSECGMISAFAGKKMSFVVDGVAKPIEITFEENHGAYSSVEEFLEEVNNKINEQTYEKADGSVGSVSELNIEVYMNPFVTNGVLSVDGAKFGVCDQEITDVFGTLENKTGGDKAIKDVSAMNVKNPADSEGYKYDVLSGMVDLSGYVSKETGKGLSTNDFTTAEQTKLAGVEEGANKTTVVDGLTSTAADSALSANQGKVLSDKITAIENKGYQTADQVAAAVNAKVSSTYKAGGSAAFADLPTADSDHLGMVYNLTDAFTTTDGFMEGAGKTYPAGTNVVIVADGDGYKYDVLSGFVDLSGYVSSGDLQEMTADEVTALWNSVTI